MSARLDVSVPISQSQKQQSSVITLDLHEDPMTPAEVLKRFKIKFTDEKDAGRKIYELTRRRGNRLPMPSHRVGKQLRFYWSEIRRWQAQVQDQKTA
jgi:hypothetical protein